MNAGASFDFVFSPVNEIFSQSSFPEELPFRPTLAPHLIFSSPTPAAPHPPLTSFTTGPTIQEIKEDPEKLDSNSTLVQSSGPPSIRRLDFHGVQLNVDLVSSATNLIHYIQAVWPGLLQTLVDNPSLIDQATSAYIRYMTQVMVEHGLVYCENDCEKPLNAEIEPDELIRLIWVCHMIDSYAYHSDCNRIFGQLIGHRLPPYKRAENSIRKYANDQNPPPPRLSMDMHSAVNWLNNLSYTLRMPHFRDEAFILSAVQRYKQFLFLIRALPTAFATLPRPADVMLVWLSHVLSPRSFKNDIQLVLGSASSVMLDRVELFPFGMQNQIVEDPVAVWNEFFDEPCLLPGTIHRHQMPVRELFYTDLFSLLHSQHLNLRIDVTKHSAAIDELYMVPRTFGNSHVDPYHQHLKRKLTPNREFSLRSPERQYHLIARNGSWPKFRWAVVGTFEIMQYLQRVERWSVPLSMRYDLGHDLGSFVVHQLDTDLEFRANETFLGLKPIPPLVAAFARVPPGTPTQIFIYQLEHSTISVHSIPEFNLFLLFEGDRPTAACKQVPNRLLPFADQLRRPDTCPCFLERVEDPAKNQQQSTTQSEMKAVQALEPRTPEACLAIYNGEGDQAYVVFDRRSNSRIRVFAMSKSFTGVQSFPVITSGRHDRLNITLSVSQIAKLGASTYSCVLLAAIAVHLMYRQYMMESGEGIRKSESTSSARSKHRKYHDDERTSSRSSRKDASQNEMSTTSSHRRRKRDQHNGPTRNNSRIFEF